MLLQRASAGSGKTFKLAKTYIRLFISVLHEESGTYRLLQPAELRDNHSHILGVTFTNKATNEMKQRIVKKLAELAKPVPVKGMEPPGYKFPDYMLDFTGETPGADSVHDVIYTSPGQPASRAEITATCRTALHVLLNDYGNFNISTIDSFFQSVLRTLTYELNIDSTYHVELNDEFLAQTGVDETLTAVKENGREQAAPDFMSEWLKDIMTRRMEQGDKWNAFSQGSNGIYGEMLEMAKKMTSESFKRNLEELKDYFADGERFTRFYKATVRASGEIDGLHKECREAARRFRLMTKGDTYSRGVDTILNAIVFSSPTTPVLPSAMVIKNCNDYAGERTRSNPFKAKTPAASDPEKLALFSDLCDKLCRWQERRQYWGSVLSRLNYMGALFYINSNIERFRRANNIIPLSETNDILHRIINRDEVPFIYERTGVRLHHFLLDEFQDTSRLQWSNLRPLLAQSDSNGHDNLIIGDAKQSIYRFRNAAPEIINGGVEEDFPATRVLPDPATAGTPAYDAVNTNWRSAMHVVDFNNRLFATLASQLDADTLSHTPDMAEQTYFSDLYANTVQAIHKDKLPGYVRVDLATEGFTALGTLIDELRGRGFPLSKITVLVDNATDGRKAIKSIREHNEAMKGNDASYAPIEFISEDSLLINESPAVKIILSVLNLIAFDFIAPESTDAEPTHTSSDRMRHFELQRLVANYNIGLWNGTVNTIEEADGSEAVVSQEQLAALYRRLGAVTLPALVEGIAGTFVQEKLQGTQAAFIAAFQDVVLSYCDTYPSDIASFLQWWSDNGTRLCIAAPDGIEAVQVMTVHKSKGLEFEAVITPKADWVLGPVKENLELIWASVVPEGLSEEERADAPPRIPVTPHGGSMHDPASPFYKDYHEFFMQNRTDQLNKTYVAFTRAVRELYVYAKTTKTVSDRIGNRLRSAFDSITASSQLRDTKLLLYDGNVLEYGQKVNLNKEKNDKETTDKKRRKALEEQGVKVPEPEPEPHIIEITRYSPGHPQSSDNALFTLQDDN